MMLVQRPGQRVPAPKWTGALHKECYMMDKIGDSLALPNHYPSVEHAVTESRYYAELRDAYLICQKDTSDINNRCDYVVASLSQQSN